MVVLENVDKIIDSGGKELVVSDAVASVSSGGGGVGITVNAGEAITAGNPVIINSSGDAENVKDGTELLYQSQYYYTSKIDGERINLNWSMSEKPKSNWNNIKVASGELNAVYYRGNAIYMGYDRDPSNTNGTQPTNFHIWGHKVDRDNNYKLSSTLHFELETVVKPGGSAGTSYGQPRYFNIHADDDKNRVVVTYRVQESSVNYIVAHVLIFDDNGNFIKSTHNAVTYANSYSMNRVTNVLYSESTDTYYCAWSSQSNVISMARFTINSDGVLSYGISNVNIGASDFPLNYTDMIEAKNFETSTDLFFMLSLTDNTNASCSVLALKLNKTSHVGTGYRRSIQGVQNGYYINLLSDNTLVAYNTYSGRLSIEKQKFDPINENWTSLPGSYLGNSSSSCNMVIAFHPIFNKHLVAFDGNYANSQTSVLGVDKGTTREITGVASDGSFLINTSIDYNTAAYRDIGRTRLSYWREGEYLLPKTETRFLPLTYRENVLIESKDEYRTTTNAESFIGIAVNSANSGEPVDITVNGSISNNSWNLTVGSNAYISYDGDVSEKEKGYAAEGTYGKIGRVISPTTILLGA